MNIPLILLTALYLSSITLGRLCYLLHQRLMILEELFPRFLNEIKKSEDAVFGIRNVVLKSMERDLLDLRGEIAVIKKKNKESKSLKHGESQNGNGYTA